MEKEEHKYKQEDGDKNTNTNRKMGTRRSKKQQVFTSVISTRRTKKTYLV